MRVLGIDCSTNSFAFAIFEDQSLAQWGEFSFGKGDIFHRMNNANKVMTRLVKDGFFDGIDIVAFEGAIFVNNRRTVIDLAYVFGSVMAPLFAPGVKVESVPAIVWQKGTGNPPLTASEKADIVKQHPGKSKSWYANKNREFRKQRTKDNVKRLYGIDTPNDDVSDAIMIGTYVVERMARDGSKTA